jgi:hypothetical protein
MAVGKLIEVMSSTTTTDLGNVTLTGINTDDVYMFMIANAVPDTADADLQIQLTESGTANGNSNYTVAIQYMRDDRDFATNSGDHLGQSGYSQANLSGSMENDVGTGGCNGYGFIYNANDSSENTIIAISTIYQAEGAIMLGQIGGIRLEENTAVDGVKFFFDSNNIRSGATFALYKVS